MALGFGKSKTNGSSSSSPPNEKAEPKFDDVNPYNDYSADQTTAEHGGSKKSKKPMNRIDRPITRSITGDSTMGDSSTDVSVSIGKQMELEADNAIKYRTCSWQKVCYGPLPFLPHSFSCHFGCMCHFDACGMFGARLWCSSVQNCDWSLRICIVQESQTNMSSRPRPCCSPSTYAWPSCHSRTPTPFSDWYRV
jgi:hypothetical protein